MVDKNRGRVEVKDMYERKLKDSFMTWFNFILFDYIVNNKEKELYEIKDKEFFLSYKVEGKTKDDYISKYWQSPDENEKIRGISINNITEKIKKWTCEKPKEQEEVMLKQFLGWYRKRFEQIFKYSDFEEMYDKRECEYCHITEIEIDKLIEKNKIYKKHITRGWTLEIDRKKPNEEYMKENCVRCCYWCNNSKTDEFCADEFRPIGEAIQKVWKKRLKS